MKKLLIVILAIFLGGSGLYAQGVLGKLGKKIVKQAGQQVEERVEQKAAEGVENAMNKVEESAKKNGSEKKKDTDKSEKNKHVVTSDKQVQTDQVENKQVSLQSFSQYDFVPGDKILIYDDFSQDAIGDFPAMWTTDGSGEVKTISLAPGNWLNMTTAGKKYQLIKDLKLPENYIIEYDVILVEEKDNSNPGSVKIELYKSESTDPGNIGNETAFTVEMASNKWIASALHEEPGWVHGESEIVPIKNETVEHVIIWVQKRRVRAYHSGKKVLDLPTILPQNFNPNRLLFSTWDCNNSTAYVSNFRITTATPDTRNKLLEEGKLISYGIYFDVNSDKVKPESIGALNDIAKVIKEAGVKVKVVGHTDNTGRAELNKDLSGRRAASVKSELVKLGVNGDLISTDGAGASEPIAANDTPANKALNRRVEFIKI